MAAQWRCGQVQIEPTTRLAADVFGVSIQLVNAAIPDAEYNRWLKERDAEHQRGLRLNGQGSPDESLAEHILRSTPEEVLEAARVVGPARVWDWMIAPIV
jgi:hypothetical protein